MALKPIFEYRDYKLYLQAVSKQRPGRGRGFRADLARAANCQTAYISQVLGGHAQLSLDQAYAISQFLIHSKEETRFFILLIQYSRAGSRELKAHFLELMEEEIKKQLNLKERFKIRHSLSQEDQATYYSDWTYAAVHIAVTVPKLQTAEAIGDFFELPPSKVQKVLKFLVATGLINQQRPGQYAVGPTRLHLPSDSPLISKHHVNWRLKAMNSLERESDTDLHYTSVVSLSQEDVLNIKTRLVKEIEAYNAIIKPSKEETMCCLALDFFSLDKQR